MKLALVLPTRHRASFAISAIRSLLSQSGCELSVIVSDNSSSEDEVRRLEQYCRENNDPRLLYVRSAAVLPMPAHWDWALDQAMSRTDATHFGIQYDRKLWKPRHLRFLADACAYAPDTLVTYGCDFTYPARSRVGCWQSPASGKLYEMRTQSVLELTSRGMIYEMGHAFPVLSNCMIPRAILERVRIRFGDICNSSTPDTAFAFRFCALEQRYLHLDRATVIVYAFEYSNGRSLFRFETGGTWDDFARLWGDRPWAGAAPISDLRVGQNVSFHEYNLVRHAVGDERFPPIDRDGYLRELARALTFIEDPARKAEVRAVLEAHGWTEDAPPPRRPLYRRALSQLLRPFRPRERTFATDDAAIQHLLDHAQPLVSHNPLLDPMQPAEVRFP